MGTQRPSLDSISLWGGALGWTWAGFIPLLLWETGLTQPPHGSDSRCSINTPSFLRLPMRAWETWTHPAPSEPSISSCPSGRGLRSKQDWHSLFSELVPLHPRKDGVHYCAFNVKMFPVAQVDPVGSGNQGGFLCSRPICVCTPIHVQHLSRGHKTTCSLLLHVCSGFQTQVVRLYGKHQTLRHLAGPMIPLYCLRLCNLSFREE